MRIRVLGSAAGGGLPQWNCACTNCSRARNADARVRARTQTQIALTADDRSWFLLNASPDLRQQILATPELAPSTLSARGTPIAGVVLTAADADFVMGLLHLREFQPLRIYATPGVRRIVTETNSLFHTLERSAPPVEWQDFCFGEEMPLRPQHSPEKPAPLRCKAIPLNGSYPDYVPGDFREILAREEAVVALVLSDGKKRFFFAPGLPGNSSTWKPYLRECELGFFDGTFWSDDELAAVRSGAKTARQMGHLPLSGSGGLLEELQAETHVRKVAIHANNTNPMLDEGSKEHRMMVDAGWTIAHDGMEFIL